MNIALYIGIVIHAIAGLLLWVWVDEKKTDIIENYYLKKSKYGPNKFKRFFVLLALGPLTWLILGFNSFVKWTTNIEPPNNEDENL